MDHSCSPLSHNGIKGAGLKFEDLLDQCVITKTTDATTGSVLRHISVTEIQLSEFESGWFDTRV